MSLHPPGQLGSWPFAELCNEPIYVFTGDQDWAPEWATGMQVQMHRDAGIPLHMFCTSPSAVMTARDGSQLSAGIHPNFLPGSSHGSSYAEIVETCMRMYPDVTTARCHAFTETSAAIRALAGAGIVADSNGATHLQPWIAPFVHYTGIVRFPVFLEDDVMMDLHQGVPSFAEVIPWLTTPGLKIFNFHPSHVGLNSASFDDYNAHRDALMSDDPQPVRLGAFGIGDFYEQLLEWVGSRRDQVWSFPRLVEQIRPELDRLRPRIEQ